MTQGEEMVDPNLLPKCKGIGHVRCVALEFSHPIDTGQTVVVYYPNMQCRQAGTSGPGIQVGSHAMIIDNRGMHIQEALAFELPAMLRAAATDAAKSSEEVALEHTVLQQFKPWRVFTVAAARQLALDIEGAMPDKEHLNG